MREIWKPAKDFEGLYEVSNMGSVKRVATSGGKGTGNYARGEHVLSQRKNNVGYKIVDLWKNGVRHQLLVHRLVAQTFIENPCCYPCVNHKDENPENNKADNLEWCTHEYNMNYGTAKHKIGKANSKGVVQFDKDGNFVKKYESIIQAQRETGVSNGSIGDCLHGRRNSAGGFKWEYEK